jgi:hypothetical protein
MKRKRIILAMCAGSLGALLLPVSALASSNARCSVEAAGSLNGGQRFELEVKRERRGLGGEVQYRDKAANLRLEARQITSVVVHEGMTLIQGIGRTESHRVVRFSVELRRAERSFGIRIGDGYKAAGTLTRKGDLDLEGDCPFDGRGTFTTDDARAVSADVGRAGGMLSSGGMILTVPPGALAETVRITMTPFASVTGTPFDASLIGGARFAPDGLRFFKPATLTMPVPAGVAAADVVGLSGDGAGSNVHLAPTVVLDGAIALQVSHFSLGGAASGGASTAGAMATFPPSGVQQQAEAAIAVVLNQTPSGAGPIIGTFLLTWYEASVRPGLQAALGRDEAAFARAAAEWQAWEGLVRVYADLAVPINSSTTLADALSPQRKEAERLATDDAASTAEALLGRCTGFVEIMVPLRDVNRIATDIELLALVVETQTLADGSVVTRTVRDGRPLPAGSELLRACVHTAIDRVEHAPVLAARRANRFVFGVGIAFWNGPTRHDLPVTVTLHEKDGGTWADTVTSGTWETTFRPSEPGIAELDLEASLPAAAADNTLDRLATVSELTIPVRSRVELQVLGPAGFADSATIRTGRSATLRVRLAGDDVAALALTYTFTGPGSLNPTTGVTDSAGEARFVYDARTEGAATISATLDGEGASDSVTLTILPRILVMVTPPFISLAAGGVTNFSAQVVNASNPAVRWTQTGGSITQGGRYTAGPNGGRFTVTATSVEDPSASDTVVVEIPAASSASPVLSDANGRASLRGPACATPGFHVRNFNVLRGFADCAGGGATAHAEIFYELTLINGFIHGFQITTSTSARSAGTIDANASADYRLQFRVQAPSQIEVHGTVSRPGSSASIYCDDFATLIFEIGPGASSIDSTLTLPVGVCELNVLDLAAAGGDFTSDSSSVHLRVTFG